MNIRKAQYTQKLVKQTNKNETFLWLSRSPDLIHIWQGLNRYVYKKKQFRGNIEAGSNKGYLNNRQKMGTAVKQYK